MGKTANNWIALIRGIGPSTYKKMSMQQLRDGCIDRSLKNVRTYIASGNLLFDSAYSKTQINTLLVEVLAGHDLKNDVFLRRPRDLKAVVSSNPFPAAATSRPNHLLVVFMNKPMSLATEKLFSEYAGPEQLHAHGREVYIDYVDGVGKSKLTPAKIDKLSGQPGTARNWNTVNKLIELSG